MMPQRFVQLGLALALCACGPRYTYEAAIDPPFLRDAAQPQPGSGPVEVRANAGISAGPVSGQLAIDVQVPEVIAPAFYGISLEGANDLIFVLDRSDSMAGNRLRRAKEELVKALDALPDGTRFNVLFFGSTVTPLSDRVVVMAPDVRELTKQFVAGIKAEGSTALVPAMWLSDRGRAKRVVILSDGEANTLGEPPDVLNMGRKMIAEHHVRFDIVDLDPHQIVIIGRSDVLQTLATESGGTYMDWYMLVYGRRQ